MNKIITVKKLVKKYGHLTAVDGISFDVGAGEVFGLLGENGAGKTTTLEIIEGLRRPTSGEVKVLGLNISSDLPQIKHKIGVQLQSSAYYQFLTLAEILNLFAAFYGSPAKPNELLEMVGLEKKATSYVGSLSGGQKQRFSIIASLVNDPEIVFLDEPTTGLDPIARRNLWNIITKIKKRGKTIVLTTHYMEEAEILCDRIAIMENGKILAIDKTHNLVHKLKYPFSIDFITAHMTQTIVKQLKKIGQLENSDGKGDQYKLLLCCQDDLRRAIDLVNSLKTESLTVGRANLEDVFVSLTGKKINE